MRRIFEFRCAKDHITEKYVDDEVKVVQCPHCGNDASRIISATRSNLDPISGDFPGAAMAWEKRRESHIAWERKTGRSDEWK